MKTQIIYVSGTGNTEKVAEAIYQAIPSVSKDIKRLDSCYEKCCADFYFIGFWVNHGSASVEVLDYLSDLHGKRIALFGTCGMGNSPEYYKQIEQNVSAFIPDDNEYLGAYFCQGKMPISVRKKYERMKTPENQEQVNFMLHNFDEALLHPDHQDLRSAMDFTTALFEKIS